MILNIIFSLNKMTNEAVLFRIILNKETSELPVSKEDLKVISLMVKNLKINVLTVIIAQSPKSGHCML